jgi:hypothetical protein
MFNDIELDDQTQGESNPGNAQKIGPTGLHLESVTKHVFEEKSISGLQKWLYGMFRIFVWGAAAIGCWKAPVLALTLLFVGFIAISVMGYICANSSS